MVFVHAPVMVQEVVRLLKPETPKRYLDGTLGGGGHAEQILIDSSPAGQLLGIDRDDEAIVAAREQLRAFGERVIFRQATFADAKEILAEIGWTAVDGVLLDLGVSSRQLESVERGFSFRANGRLDMRMDRRQTLDACQLVNSLPVAELEKILRNYGEEPQAHRIALALVSERKLKPLETTAELARLVERVKARRGRNHHPATQTFQALRIAVNEELQQLERFLEDGYELLKPQGRMAIISFHSLEDRLVKTAFRKWNQSCLCPPKTPTCRCGWSRKAKLLTKRPLVAPADEVRANPRARSAKLRVIERI
jgi:16S rRNA (cytosine1402-N4)-methyltransferase